MDARSDYESVWFIIFESGARLHDFAENQDRPLSQPIKNLSEYTLHATFWLQLDGRAGRRNEFNL